ncbi:2-amino-4-hydroxy-6- hydroxymethyldihydropteridine pyrophosphokinase [Chitinispirillum alkaliphilum]|nr:2-amino-4-hydroxy-6- hydroxymethyldihydropteridine pyrophosphokinase [Chitinispirillum alkaliphilum]
MLINHNLYYIKKKMTKVALSLGTNIGNRAGHLKAMQRGISKLLCSPVTFSSPMETSALEVEESHPPYLNQIVCGFFSGTAFELLDMCKALEHSLGRTHKGMKKPRTADIDILLFGEEQICSQELTIPHRAILKRLFCLKGLNQVCPELSIPGTGKTVRENLIKTDSEIKKQNVLFLTDSQLGFEAIYEF